MKKVKKSSKAEPTISDVMGAVQTLAGRFDGLEKTNKTLVGKFDVLEVSVQDLTEAVQIGFERHEKILKTLVEGQDELRESVHLLDQRVSKTQNRIEDVVDENTATLLNHGRRITILEKARA
ncbi:MAG: hypothetical protein NUV60_02525 [Patescibacteria group bacterium]|nr:hypothetical protein [Patescibacteria group bacterium]